MSFYERLYLCIIEYRVISYKMAAKKGKNKKKNLVKLVSASGYVYYTYKNPKNTEGKLELNKYDPNTRRHEKFIETK